ncbi:MAG: bifunctional [glutamate--ammonia ligase]-adenylyl-L-tyrosine phosphorylase/[glutamate--ammonia-ligase] adenylyltransferase [Labilithrix sp.]|nr:bifunctional [glutamate--ammonia ligase]-adenylyl-L-tyrosine phosphorylase/[glutamate--ammonia-ligase] adenylyltransferase [Labilithrix sp.]MCW5817101.1 bifunctional [glutamate--ammonia ligase]-adenylyl-L-tyrosine phosphorylase/[glutamate--ammonia-ligase] adenylyltransferase [Labilithrix sp.]
MKSEETTELMNALSAAYPALRAQIARRPEDVAAIGKGRLRIARDLRTYRRLAATFVPDLTDLDAVRRGLRLFAQRERLRVAARELRAREAGDVDVTARELSDLAQACIEVALAEASRWAEERFGAPMTASGERCAFTVLGMGKLGGRELNCGSDVDLIPFYETDEGEVVKDGVPGEQTLHEHFARITQRWVATLDDVTEDGMCWRVDLRLRPEGARGPLVNALAAAERYYETWGRTWERAAMVRARPIAGDPAFGARVIDALVPFVWRKAIDPRIAPEMAQLALRARKETSHDPDRDLKLGAGGIREAEFFVQSLQLIWGGREPTLRHTNTLQALRRLRARGLVTDRESREVEAAYLTLRRLEHRVQFATGIQTHVLPRGDMLEAIARSLGHASGLDLEREVDKTRRRVAARLASLTKDVSPGPTVEDDGLEALLTAIESGEEAFVLTAIAEGAGGFHAASGDLARHLLALARRPDFPLGGTTRDRHPGLAAAVIEALEGAADPEQAARLLAAFFARLGAPSVYSRAMAEDTHVLRRLVGLFGASAFLGESMVYRPELMDSVVFAKITPRPEVARSEVEIEVAAAAEATEDTDATDALVGALRRAKARVTMEVGLAELAGELRAREATLVLSALADETLERAVTRALAERGLEGGLAVIAMGKLGGREIGYGSDLDIFFVYEAPDDLAEKYVRAAQRVLSLVSTPHGQGPGYELDTRLRPSGNAGLLVVSVDAFARYHEEQGQAWERQALVKARACAGDVELGRRTIAIATKVAYERGAPDAEAMFHLRMRIERELAREGPRRYDVKLGRGGIVDVEFAVQWLQMKHGADPRVRTTDTDQAIGALEACGYLDSGVAAVFREGYALLRRLEQALRVVHGTSASLIEEGAPGLPALARRMGFRDGTHGPTETAAEALLERYRAVTRDVRAAYLAVLGIADRIVQGSAMT